MLVKGKQFLLLIRLKPCYSYILRYVVFEFSQTIPYSRACVMYNDFLDRAQLLMPALLKQGYVAPSLKSSLQKLTKGEIKNGLSRETGNIGHTQDDKNTHNTTQKTRKMNNTWTPPKTGGEPRCS
jgi:hypothetical protein